MARRNYARWSGVIVDSCPSHGIWFDHDELRLIVEFLRSGGAQYAQETDRERRRSEIERKMRELRLFGPSEEEHKTGRNVTVAPVLYLDLILRTEP